MNYADRSERKSTPISEPVAAVPKKWIDWSASVGRFARQYSHSTHHSIFETTFDSLSEVRRLWSGGAAYQNGGRGVL
jgi:hypothetical protein